MNRIAILGCAVLAAAGLVARASAADVACAVGQQVQGEMGGGKPAELAEIGTEPPHVGWYRLVWHWNSPGGDWFDPATWPVHPAGSSDRCVVGAASAASARSATSSTGVSSDDDARTAAAPAPTTRPAPAPAPAPATASSDATALATGPYTCTAPAAGTFPITIESGSTYTDRKGTRGEYSRDGNRLVFSSGSLAGQYGRVLGPTKFGLSSAPAKQLYVTCNPPLGSRR